MKKLNFINIIQSLLPPTKRMPLIVAFLKVLSAPVQALNDWISGTYYPDITRRTKWNAQVLLFSKLLNDLFNAGNYQNRVYIDAGASDLENNYFYRTHEEQPVYLYTVDEALPMYSYNEEEYEADYDFVVNYPSMLATKAPQIEATVKKYKIAGTTYLMKGY
ncbi:hypothetical protein ABID22_000138 [Pontibacter aydingkolensis]|uniref:Uncharacterized protein n=1 Tax=Pontibacter aydingkolensis TaxID=1911536 RepID=A0ABS7CQR8_9BACT|nr:hypothetical protein [Pontibacter aydingkolensis]MBW7466194.1 hypothetical protein [Pontibacter aydingkolensis]